MDDEVLGTIIVSLLAGIGPSDAAAWARVIAALQVAAESVAANGDRATAARYEALARYVFASFPDAARLRQHLDLGGD